MFFKRISLIATLVVALVVSTEANAQSTISAADFPPDEFFRAKVLEVSQPTERTVAGQTETVQTIKVRLLSGKEKGREIEIEQSDAFRLSEAQKVKPDDKAVVLKTYGPNEPVYYLTDSYRLPSLAWVLAIFFGLVIFFGRLKGMTSMMGLVFSILVLAVYIVPNIIKGGEPLTVTLIGALAIVLVSLYLAHGFNKRTSIALLATIIALGLSALLAGLFVYLAKLFGTGSEEAFYLQIGPNGAINLRGLLLGGIIIGTLGVLDDITTAQTAAIEEIHKADTKLSFSELYRRGLSVGREHISSLVNTLALAYAGASLPVFLLFSQDNRQPLWVILNGEFIAEELVRTLVGSSALVLAVPLSSFLAAFFFSRSKKVQ